MRCQEQAIRVQLIAPDRFLWAYDNASPLYRVTVSRTGGTATIVFLTPPQEQGMFPLTEQVVEILPWGAVLANGEHIADHPIAPGIGGGVYGRVLATYNPVTKTLTASITDIRGRAIPGKVATWSSSNPNVATVSATGRVQTVALGTATITATCDGQSGTSVVTVTPINVATIAVVPATATLPWIWGGALLTVLVIGNLTYSSYGRALTAICEDEIAAEAAGIPTTRYKVLAFAISAMFTGLAGSLYAHDATGGQHIDPGSFRLDRSVDILVDRKSVV